MAGSSSRRDLLDTNTHSGSPTMMNAAQKRGSLVHPRGSVATMPTELPEPLIFHREVLLKPGHHFGTHLRQVLVAGVLVDHAAEVVGLAVQSIERNELLLE